MIYTLVKIELSKIFRKWRTYIGFLAITVLVLVIQIAISYEGEQSINYMTRNLQDSFLFIGNLLNGYLISHMIMNGLFIHIPFLIALVAGDLLAGEATAGTYRLLLTHPVSRTQLIVSKFISGITYTSLLVLWLAIMSLGLGIIMFGTGELLVIRSSTIIILARDDIIWRFLLAYGYAVLSMSVVASLAFLFSSLVENAIGPIISTMAIIIIFIIISAINVNIFQAIRPYLFTTYMPDWKSFFDNPLQFNEIIKSVFVLAVHIVVFFFVTLFLFKRKDILT